MARDRSKERRARRGKSAQEKKELERLRKRLDDFVKKHGAAGTAAGRGYETEVQKRQDAIDEFYSVTEAGKRAARRKKAKQAAATESVDLEAQITELREAPVRLSRKKRGELEDLEKQLAKKRKTAKGVDPRHEAAAAKKRSDATSAVTKLRRELAKARRDARAGRAKLVEELGKELAKAERRLERLEANDTRKKELDGLSSRLEAVVARINPGTALARDVETCCTALTTRRKLKRRDTSAEDEALDAAVVALEKAGRGGGQVREIVEKALEAVQPDEKIVRKRRSRQKADGGVEDAEVALADAKRQRRDGKAGDHDVKEAEKALDRAKRQQSRVEACDERASLRRTSSERLDAIEGTKKRGGRTLVDALRKARDAVIVFVRQERPISEEETDALNNMMDVLANDSGRGVGERYAQAIEAFVEASTSSPKARLRKEASCDVAELKAQLDALPDRDDVDHDEEARAKVEAELEKAKARVSKLERTDEWTKAAEEVSQGLRELKGSGTGDAAYEKSLDDADAVLANFRGRLTKGLDLSEAEAKLRGMLQALLDSPGRGQAARTARDKAVTNAREALMTHKEVATFWVDGLKEVLKTAPAVYAYQEVKDALAEASREALAEVSLDNLDQVRAIVREAIAEARKHVDALERLRDTLSRRDQRDVGGFVGDARKALESLENRSPFLGRLEVAEGALSRLDDERDELREPRDEAAAFGRFCEAASTACTALGIATGWRVHVATLRQAEYNREIEEAARLHDELKGFKETGGSGSAWDEELRRREDAYKAAFAKTPTGKRIAALEAQLRMTAAERDLLPDEVCDEARALAEEGIKICGDFIIVNGLPVYAGIAKRTHWRAEALAAVMRDSALIRNADGGPISEEQVEVVAAGHTSCKVVASFAEKLVHHGVANCRDHTPRDYLFSQCGPGALTHTVGDSTLYIAAVKMRPGDKQRPSSYNRGRVFELSPAFEAELRARTSSKRMPDKRARGDLDERMMKDSRQRAVYHAYTRGPWSVHRWSPTPTSPFVDEQRWLWLSADDARAWTQKKIDQKTSERGGYVIEDDDE